MSHTVHCHHGKTVGYGMPTLHGGPCFALALLLLGCVAAFIAYCGGVDEQFGSCESHEACCFRIPLVPADKYAEASHAGVDGVEPDVAWREVEFLIVGGVVGYVHLAVFAGNAAVAFQHHGGVVVQAGSATFEK